MPDDTRGLRIGLVAYSSNTGLGIQTQEFAEHIHPAKIMLVDLSMFNGMALHLDRFLAYDCIQVSGIPTESDIDRFLDGLDIVFVCETPLNYALFSKARERGIKTVLQPNHEFNDYYPRPYLPVPDLFALPSPWHISMLPFPNKILLAVPIATEKLPSQDITKFRRFLHIAGRPAVHDRNGTNLLIEAFSKVENPDITLTIRIQNHETAIELRRIITDPRILVDDTDVLEYSTIYDSYDCMIMPRRYGGLCLPMQEALGCGMPVIMPDISPNQLVLPEAWCVPAQHAGTFLARTEIDIYDVDIDALSAKIADLANAAPQEVRWHVGMAQRLRALLAWDAQRDIYLDVFENLVRNAIE